MRIEHVNYRGWPEAYRCTMGLVELVVVTTIGPRILSLRFDGGANVLYEDETDFGRGAWRLYGGHRFATAPESAATYTSDNAQCDARITCGRLVIAQPVDASGLQKTWTIGPNGRTPGFEIVHELTNQSRRAWYGAPWACTCVKPDGSVIIPRPSPANTRQLDLEDWFPCPPEAEEIGTPAGDVRLVADSEGARYWALTDDEYAGPTSPQWGWNGDHFVTHPPLAKGKVGLFSPEGCLAFVRSDLTFRIHAVELALHRAYPHGGCNVEVYTSAHYLELETLGPLTTLAPGEQLTHRQLWQLTRSVLTRSERAVYPGEASRKHPHSPLREPAHE
jgi:hypothetical protein